VGYALRAIIEVSFEKLGFVCFNTEYKIRVLIHGFFSCLPAGHYDVARHPKLSGCLLFGENGSVY